MISSWYFGDSKDAKIEYDENGSDSVQVTGAPWVYNVAHAISTYHLVVSL